VRQWINYNKLPNHEEHEERRAKRGARREQFTVDSPQLPVCRKEGRRKRKCLNLNHEGHPALNKRTHLTGQAKEDWEVKKSEDRR
jgi:hypothetical protein